MKYLKILLIHLLLGFSNLLFSQQYPVNVSANLLTPMPSKLSSFSSDNVQKLFVTLTNKDLTNPSIPAKLKLTLIGSSAQIVSKAVTKIPIAPILLNAGEPLMLTQQDLAPYFNINNLDFVSGFSGSQYNNGGVLPEGNYSVCVQVLDYYNDRPLSKPFCMYGSVFFSQPPMLLAPQSKNVVNGSKIQFIWVPTHLNNKDVTNAGYKYVFILKEILDINQNINQAYATAREVYKDSVAKEITQLTLFTSTMSLVSGRKYAWTVQVVANTPEAQSTLANNGVSPIWEFTYDLACGLPTGVGASADQSQKSFKIRWTNSTSGKVSSVRYKQVNGVEYEKQVNLDDTKVVLDGLLGGTTYEYSLVVKCGTNTLVTYPKSFAVLAQQGTSSAAKALFKGKVYWNLKESVSREYIATGSKSNTIFQDISSNPIETLIPNHKLGLSVQSNDTVITLNTCDGTLRSALALNGAKVDLWENDKIIESSTTNEKGEYEIAVDTGRLSNNSDAKYYLKFSRPDNLMGRDSIDLSKPPSGQNFTQRSQSRTGKDILTKMEQKKIILFSGDYLVIHPIVCVGVNQAQDLRYIRTSKIDVFILTNDKKSLPNRILDYTDNPSTDESYNGESYSLIGTLNADKKFLPIETFNNDREKLLFKVSIDGGLPTQYYSIKRLPENYQFKIVTIPLEYNPMRKVQGKVYKNLKNELEGLNKSAVIVYDKSTNKILDGTTTNSDGTYVLSSVPFTNFGNFVFYAAAFNEYTKVIDKEVVTPDYTVPSSAWQNNPIQIDMNYGKTRVDIVYGQALLSETGKAVANAVIYYNDVKVGKTSEDGFFAFRLSASQKEPEKFKIVCDGKVLDPSQTINIVKMAFSKWAQQAEPKAYNKKKADKDKPNSDLFNHFITNAKRYGDQDAQTIRIVLDTAIERLGNYYLANCSLKHTFYYKLNATIRGVKQPVLLKDLEEDRMIPINTADTTLLLSPDLDRYQVNINPAPNQQPFLEIKNLALYFSSDVLSLTIALTPLAKITGTVTDKLTNKLLDDVTVKVDRLGAQSVSNTEGVFEVIFGETSEVTLITSREGYFSKKTIVKMENALSKTINIPLEAAPIISIPQLAGFKTEITRQAYVEDSVYRIWGRILLNSNDVFSLGDQASLTFKGILVRVGEDGNARPQTDFMAFEESQVNGKMFGFAPLDIREIQLRKKPESPDFRQGDITGVVTVQASTFSQVNTNFPFKFGNATLQKPNNFPYIYLFTSDTKKYKDNYYLKFNEAQDGYVKTTFIKTGSVNVSEDSCTISKIGINLIGNVALPNAIFIASTNVSFKGLQMDTQFNVTDFEIDLSSAPLSVKLKKWRLEIKKIKLMGLNDPKRRGFGFSGALHLTKKNGKSKEEENVLTIKTFEIKNNAGGGTDVTAEFIPPSKGISVKSLTFTPSDSEIKLAYSEEEGFSLKCAGNITITGPKSKFSKVTDKIFPLEVVEFSIKSKNWAVFAALKPNMQFDFKGVKLAVSQVILNVGTDMSIDKMNEYLVSGPPEDEEGEGEEAEAEESDEPKEFDEEDPKTGWAFGVNAEVSFDKAEVKGNKKKGGKSGSITTSFTVGNFNNAIDFRINEIEIELKTPTVELEAKVQFSLAGDSIGVAGECSATIGTVSIDKVSFHYYKIKDTYLAFGGEVLVGGLNVPLGPVTMYSLGGGFNYNSETQIMEAYFMGEGGPNGTTKETARAYFDIKKLGVRFKTKECGAKPILIGDMDVYMKKPDKTYKNIGNLYGEIDFCKGVLFVKGKADFNDLIPEVEANVDIVLYIIGNTGVNKPMLFMAAEATIKVASSINARGQIALGVNFDVERDGLPQVVKDLFNNIPEKAKSGRYTGGTYVTEMREHWYGTTPDVVYIEKKHFEMNAFYVDVSADFTREAGFSFKVPIIYGGMNYHLTQTIHAGLLLNFATDNYEANFGIGASFTGSVYVGIDLGVIGNYRADVGLSASGYVELAGGYKSGNFFVEGAVGAKVEAWIGSCNQQSDCNNYCTTWGVAPTGAKICASVEASMTWSTNEGFKFVGLK